MLGAEPVSSGWTVSALHYWVNSPAPYIKRLLVFYFTEFNSFDCFSPPCSHLILFNFAQLTFWVNLFSFFFWSLCFPFYFPIIHAVVFSSYLIFCKTFTVLCFNFLFSLACSCTLFYSLVIGKCIFIFFLISQTFPFHKICLQL